MELSESPINDLNATLKGLRIWFEKADPVVQISLLLFSVVVISNGSIGKLAIVLAFLFWLFVYGLPFGEFMNVKKTVVAPGDAATLTPQLLSKELNFLDPDSRFEFLYSQPEIFHLLFQVRFIKHIASGTFERILLSADRYAEISYTVKQVQSRNNPTKMFDEVLHRARTLLNDFYTFPVEVALSNDLTMRNMFQDTGEALRVVLKRDVKKLQSTVTTIMDRNPDIYPSLTDVDGPRAPEDLDDMMMLGSKTLF